MSNLYPDPQPSSASAATASGHAASSAPTPAGNPAPRSPFPPARLSPERLALCAIAAAALLAYFFHAVYYVFWHYDDTFISVRYAMNLVRHGALEYNPGERVEGCSNFLWTLQLALAGRLGLPMFAAARLMGLAEGAGLFLLGLAFLQRFLRELGVRPGARLAGALALGVIFACCNLLAAHAQTGMETLQHALLLALAFLAAARAGRSGRPRTLALAAGALALAMLNRPEGFGYYPFFLGALLLGAPRRLELLRRRWPLLGLPLLALALLTAWRLWYYGLPLPLPVIAKRAIAGPGLVGTRAGLSDIQLFLCYGGHRWYYLILGPLAASLFLPRRGGLPGWARAQLAALALLVAANWLFVIKAGGDVLSFSRFLVPTILPLALLLAAALAVYAERAAAARGPARLGPLAALLALASLGGALAWGQAGNLFHSVDYFSHQASVTPKVQFWSFTPKCLREGKILSPIAWFTGYGGLLVPFWLDQIMPGQSVVIGDIGMPGMIGDRVRIVDMNGLVDPAFARLCQAPRGTPAYERCKRAVFARLDRVRPEWFILVAHAPAAVELFPGLPFKDWPGSRDYELAASHLDWGEALQDRAPERYLTVMRRKDTPLPDPAGVRRNYERFLDFFRNVDEAGRVYRQWAENDAAGPLFRVLALDPADPARNRVAIPGATLRGERFLGRFDDALPEAGWSFAGLAGFVARPDLSDKKLRYPYQGFVGRGLLNSAGDKADEHPETAEALSPPFVPRPGDYLGFLVGGGCAEGTGVALLEGETARREWHGLDSGRLRFVLVDLTPYAGRPLRLKVFDRERGRYGFVLADHFLILRAENK